MNFAPLAKADVTDTSHLPGVLKHVHDFVAESMHLLFSALIKRYTTLCNYGMLSFGVDQSMSK